MRNFRFWLVLLATIAAMVITAQLGRWQLSRASQKEALQAAMVERGALPAVAGQRLGASPDLDALLHRSVVLQGQWLPEHTVFLDNRPLTGRVGFYVMTPLRLEGPEAMVVLVQRGWVPRDFQDRTRLPTIDTPTHTVQVQGRIAAAPARLYEFNASSTNEATPQMAASAPRIRQNLALSAFAAETGLPLAHWMAVQTGEDEAGLSRQWPAVNTGVDKHYGYAFQWFGLCGLIALLYVWFQFVRRYVPQRRASAA